MRALAAAIQEGRADLHLSVDELAERSGIRSDDIWRLLGEPLAPVEESLVPDRQVLDSLAHGLHQRPEVLYRAALVDAGLVDGSEVSDRDDTPDGEQLAGPGTWVSVD